MALLEVEHLSKHFPIRRGLLKRTVGYYQAVNDVSFSIETGETFGLVGESGCGKTTVGKSILRLLEPTAGTVTLDGEDITAMDKETLRRHRTKMQIIFQDPYSSLNPRMTVKALIAEPLLEYSMVASKKAVTETVKEVLSTVGLNSRDIEKYPHEFSGGQRQRIMIARALVLNPKLVICDEPVSALDVSVQAQILNLMQDLQEKTGVSYLFIAHGMPVVQHISQHVGVMYLGSLVEVADSIEIFTHHLHPYTQALMSAIPSPDPSIRDDFKLIKGEIPNQINLPKGCLFANRCAQCSKRCLESTPVLREVAPGHLVACHNV